MACIKESISKEEYESMNFTYVKGILYIAKDVVLSDKMKQMVNQLFDKIPLVVLRVDTLPKQSQIELEMIVMPLKENIEAKIVPKEHIIVSSKENDQTLYCFAKFDNYLDAMNFDVKMTDTP